MVLDVFNRPELPFLTPVRVAPVVSEVLDLRYFSRAQPRLCQPRAVPEAIVVHGVQRADPIFWGAGRVRPARPVRLVAAADGTALGQPVNASLSDPKKSWVANSSV